MDDPLCQLSKNNPLKPGVYVLPLMLTLLMYSGDGASQLLTIAADSCCLCASLAIGGEGMLLQSALLRFGFPILRTTPHGSALGSEVFVPLYFWICCLTITSCARSLTTVCGILLSLLARSSFASFMGVTPSLRPLRLHLDYEASVSPPLPQHHLPSPVVRPKYKQQTATGSLLSRIKPNTTPGTYTR